MMSKTNQFKAIFDSEESDAIRYAKMVGALLAVVSEEQLDSIINYYEKG